MSRKKQIAEPCWPPLPGTRTSAVHPPPGVVTPLWSCCDMPRLDLKEEQRGARDTAGYAERHAGDDIAHVVHPERDAGG